MQLTWRMLFIPLQIAACALPRGERAAADPDTAGIAREAIAVRRGDLLYWIESAAIQDTTRGARITRFTFQVRAANIGRDTAVLEMDLGLPPPVLGRPTGTEVWVWDSRAARFWPHNVPLENILISPTFRLAPGDTMPVHRANWSSPEVLGDSLPAGRYTFMVLVPVNGDTVRVPAGELTVPPARVPVRAVSELDGFRYTAVTRLVRAEPQTWRTTVYVANAGMRPVLTRWYSRGCPVRLRGYATAEARETVPSTPIWMYPASCAEQEEVSITLRTADRDSLYVDFTATEVLGDSLPARTYYLVADVRTAVGLRPQDRAQSQREGRRVLLNAGAVELQR